MSGAGNTFFVGFRDQVGRTDEELSAFTREECVGGRADGVLLLEKKEAGAWKWFFFNADGSRAEMCGNAARCAARFLETYDGGKEFLFNTGAGPIRARAREGVYEVVMSLPRVLNRDMNVEANGRKYFGAWVDTGVPHFVIRVNRLEEITTSEASALRHHKDFGAPGANVTLYCAGEGGVVLAKTFERGVEDFTQACGTGAVAAAFVVSLGRPQAFTVRMPGGDLVVDLSNPQPLLVGDAIFTSPI